MVTNLFKQSDLARILLNRPSSCALTLMEEQSEKLNLVLLLVSSLWPRTQFLDVGAGIGRISKLLLSRFFDAVDLVEVTQKFLDEAKKDLANFEQVKNFYCSSMQV